MFVLFLKTRRGGYEPLAYGVVAPSKVGICVTIQCPYLV